MTDPGEADTVGLRVLEALTDAGVVTPDDAAEDLRLADEFHREWERRMGRLDDRDPTTYLALLLEVDPDELSVTAGEGLVVTHSGRQVGEWPSRAALLADVAAATLLGEWLPVWTELDGETRDELVARLRIFLETCPSCGGDLVQEAIDGDRPVQYGCAECGTQLV